MPAPKEIDGWLVKLAARVEALEQRQNRSLAGTGMSVPEQGVTQVDGSLIVESGDVKSGNYVPATSGWHLPATGVPEFKDIQLYDLPNSMLANPVSPARLHDDAQNFAVTTSWQTIMSAAVTVPEGYTQALIFTLTTDATAYNSSASVDFLYCRAQVNGGSTGGWTLGSADVDPSGTGVSADFQTALISSLTPGSTLTFEGQVHSAFAGWAASLSNVANIDVALLWLR